MITTLSIGQNNKNMNNDKPNGIAVYGGSYYGKDPAYKAAAEAVGAAIAQRGLITVNGGGNMGLMGATIDGALRRGGSTIGVLPEFMVKKGWEHPSLTECRVVADMHQRKATMAQLSRGVIALPGGVGTFEEITEMITWRKLGLFTGNVVILNINGYYNPLLEMFARAEAEGFMRSGLVDITDNADDAVALAAQ